MFLVAPWPSPSGSCSISSPLPSRARYRARPQNLSISQSSVTEAIKELESDLGVELFERHPRGLNITHKGDQFLRHATKMPAERVRRRTFFGDHEATTGRLDSA